MFITGIILLLIVTVFVLENRDLVTIQFLSWNRQVELGLALVAAALLGAIVMYFSGLLKQRELRAQARAAESRLREMERQQQRQAAADEGQQAPRP